MGASYARELGRIDVVCFTRGKNGGMDLRVDLSMRKNAIFEVPSKRVLTPSDRVNAGSTGCWKPDQHPPLKKFGFLDSRTKGGSRIAYSLAYSRK